MPGAPARYGYYVVPVGADRLVGHSGGGGDLGLSAELELLWNADYTLVILGNCDLPQTQMLAHSIIRFLSQPSPQKGPLAKP